jgi:hypothetical protein
MGQTILKGDNLNSNILKEITRSAASTGDDVYAWLKFGEHEKRVRKGLKGSIINIQFSVEELEEENGKVTLISEIRDFLNRIRVGKN